LPFPEAPPEQRGKVAKEDWFFNFGSFKVFPSNAVLERKKLVGG
jgi:hypothetical protein